MEPRNPICATADLCFIITDDSRNSNAELQEDKMLDNTSDLDEEVVLTAFNSEDYEYTMSLQFVDPCVEKEYLKNTKMKVLI